MTVGSIIPFSQNKDRLSLRDLLTAAPTLALLTSAWTPDATSTGNAVWGDISANEIAAGNGYTAGGVALGTPSVTNVSGVASFFTSNAYWLASSGGFGPCRYAVLYANSTLWGRTKPLIGYVLLDVTPADVPKTTAGNYLQISCPAAGWIAEL